MTEPQATETPAEQGVQFASRDGRRSSTGAGKAIFAAAVGGVDEDLAREITRTKDWRKSYLGPVRRVVEAGVPSAKDATRIATDGLAAVRDHLVYIDEGQDLSLPSAFRDLADQPMHSAVVQGEGEAERELIVPYRGEQLRGDALLDQIERWRERGILEESAAAALRRVVGNPEWLDLSDRTFALLGASSQMGPLEMITKWRGNVIAVDLPRPHLWEHILSTARAGAGRMHVLSTRPVTPETATTTGGVDLLVDAPRVARWITEFEGPVTLGNYVYADGANFVRLAGAVDALVAEVQEHRRDVALAYLATPTDVFAVPEEVARAATQSPRVGWSRARRLIRPLTAGKTFVPNYRHSVADSDGRRWGIADSLIPIQGPNYALAKALQRWRALVARDEGTASSANVAPSTRTTSVTKNRVLAAAYKGAGAFGVEIFEPETSRALMAALLVHDLRHPGAPAQPGTDVRHPFELFSEAAVHGGLWRLPWEPRSVLPLALLMGVAKRP